MAHELRLADRPLQRLHAAHRGADNRMQIRDSDVAGQKLSLQVNVENLFNQRYIINADSNTNLSPGSPHALRVGLTTRF